MRIEKGKEEIIIYAYTCDLCGKESSRKTVCSICNRDICSTCTKLDPRDMSDYPAKYCDECFQIGKPYIDKIYTEEEKFDALIEKLEQEWRDEAIKRVKINK